VSRKTALDRADGVRSPRDARASVPQLAGKPRSTKSRRRALPVPLVGPTLIRGLGSADGHGPLRATASSHIIVPRLEEERLTTNQLLYQTLRAILPNLANASFGLTLQHWGKNQPLYKNNQPPFDGRLDAKSRISAASLSSDSLASEPPRTRTENRLIKSNALFARRFELESRGFRPPSGKNQPLLVSGFAFFRVGVDASN
jgi:hypothetical protein